MLSTLVALIVPANIRPIYGYQFAGFSTLPCNGRSTLRVADESAQTSLEHSELCQFLVKKSAMNSKPARGLRLVAL